ncbi:methyltransferase, FxLD system [Actinomadura viridis]|uniref:methyltransferase, FxLD system n=1 Tax=Actinomadura viridis TaxID=58110 RepID=UPI0036C87C3F
MTTVREAPEGTPDAAVLRAAMVRELRDEYNAITSDAVAAAVATVPRHLFAVGEPLKAAYAANNALVIKRDTRGAALSSLSATHIQAVMLEQAGIDPGMRVLEVGSGGYNAALIQELVGASGTVVSVDIDRDIAERARTCLVNAGYGRVEVVLADAEHGVPGHAPYDRIIVTAGACDIPPAWVDQLRESGRIVVPLRLRGLTRSIAFDHDGRDLVSRSYQLSGFVPMQGAGSGEEQLVSVGDGATLRIEDQPRQHFDVDALRNALGSPRLERWSGTTFDLPDEQELFLMTSAPNAVVLQVKQELVDQGRFAPSAARGVPALVSGGTLAYRTKRPNPQTGGYESGVFAHGPEAEVIAEHYVELLRRWARDHFRRGAARIRYLSEAPNAPVPSPGLIAKRHGTVEVSWP